MTMNSGSTEKLFFFLWAFWEVFGFPDYENLLIFLQFLRNRNCIGLKRGVGVFASFCFFCVGLGSCSILPVYSFWGCLGQPF